MKTKTVNARKTKPMRFRISGTSRAARKFVNKADYEASTSSNFAPAAASASRALCEKRTSRKTRPCGSVFPGLVPPRIFTPSRSFLSLPFSLSDCGVPIGQIAEIDDREGRAEVPDVARLLRIAQTMREPAGPRRLTAFEARPFPAPGTDGLSLPALAAGLHQTRTVAAPDAGTFRPRSLLRRQPAEGQRRALRGRSAALGPVEGNALHGCSPSLCRHLMRSTLSRRARAASQPARRCAASAAPRSSPGRR